MTKTAFKSISPPGDAMRPDFAKSGHYLRICYRSTVAHNQSSYPEFQHGNPEGTAQTPFMTVVTV
jgi:hypothetical protein